MSKTFQCLSCKDTCHIIRTGKDIKLKCCNCGEKDITEEEVKGLEMRWRKGHK